MSRFERAMGREMVVNASVALVALTAIFAVVMLVRVLGRAAIGDFGLDAVLPLLGFRVMVLLPVLSSLALFVGVYMTLTRWWRDSEAVIWMNGGIGPWGWARAVLMFAVPVVLLIALISLELAPRAAARESLYRQTLDLRDQVSSLAAGVFSEDAQGRRVLFVESLSEDEQRVGNVFVHTQDRGRIGVTLARQGHIELADNGDTFLVLHQGRRYEGLPGDADLWAATFTRYGVRIPPQVVAERAPEPRALGVKRLLAEPDPRHLAEWGKRISVPISALLLCLLAVPLSYVNPRAGRSLNVVFAILLFMTYNNVIGLTEGWVARGELSLTQGLLATHGAVLGLLAWMFWRRFHTLPAR